MAKCQKKNHAQSRLSLVAHTYNPSYLAGRQEDCSSRPVKQKVSKTPSQTNLLGIVVQAVIPSYMEV
jgi:hypothetical protein